MRYSTLLRYEVDIVFVVCYTYIMKTCNGCKRELSLDEFNKNRTHHDGLQSRCRWCNNRATEKHYEENKQYYLDKQSRRIKTVGALGREYLMKYLLEHPCVDCNNTDIEVLEFDHRDPKEKLHNVGSMAHAAYSVDAIKQEVLKCDVRCANCHVKKTRRQFGYWTYNAVV